MLLSLAPAAQAADAGPSARLAAALGDLFPASSLVDATGGGEPGAQVTEVTPGAAQLGVQRDDIVLRVEGQPLGGKAWDPARARPAGGGPPTLMVWRAVPGTRIVQAPETAGREALDQFIALPAEERTPMRLAVMLGNQGTVVLQGAGVALLPAEEKFDSARWLHAANPLPPESETAIQQIATALRKRTRMPPASGEEIAAAEQNLKHGSTLEARERAQRVMVAAAREPGSRSAPSSSLDDAVRIYNEANQEIKRREAVRTMPEPLLAVVVEGNASYIKKFVPQRTLMNVDNSWGWGAQGGLRLRLAPGGVPFLSSLFLLAEAGYYRNNFDDLSGNPFLHVGLTQFSFEGVYRPHVAAILRPYLRGGVGIYNFSGSVQCGSPDWTQVIDWWDVGGLVGVGFDVYQIPKWHMTASLGGSYRILTSKFDFSHAPLLGPGCGSNTRPEVKLENGFYEFNLGGTQLGFMLTFTL